MDLRSQKKEEGRGQVIAAIAKTAILLRHERAADTLVALLSALSYNSHFIALFTGEIKEPKDNLEAAVMYNKIKKISLKHKIMTLSELKELDLFVFIGPDKAVVFDSREMIPLENLTSDPTSEDCFLVPVEIYERELNMKAPEEDMYINITSEYFKLKEKIPSEKVILSKRIILMPYLDYERLDESN